MLQIMVPTSHDSISHHARGARHHLIQIAANCDISRHRYIKAL
jgi:hypothetical protein